VDWGIVTAKKLQGKELSYNNYLDLDSAWNLVSEFRDTACVILKHNTPCGVAIATHTDESFRLAQACDPVSAFGGIVGFNREVDGQTAQEMTKIFLECVIAPGYRPEAMEVFKKKENLRLLQMPSMITAAAKEFDVRRISGGLLVQEKDYPQLTETKIVTKRAPTPDEMASLEFGWRVVKHVKSNAMLLTRGLQTVGLGAGQMSRVDALKVAWMKLQQQQTLILGHQRPLVLSSDAFFPFRDCVDEAAKIGISAIIQPGGSIRDEDSIRAATNMGSPWCLRGCGISDINSARARIPSAEFSSASAHDETNRRHYRSRTDRGSLGQALRRSKRYRVIGLGRNAAKLRKAKRRGAVDAFSPISPMFLPPTSSSSAPPSIRSPRLLIGSSHFFAAARSLRTWAV